MKRAILVLSALFLVTSSGSAEKVREGWMLGTSLSGSLNPLGADLGTKVSYLVPLKRAGSGPLWDSAAVEAGLQNSLTPAYEQISAFFRYEPVAVFDLTLQAGFRYAYDLLGFGFTRIAGRDAAYDSSTRRDLSRTSGPGLRFSLNPTLKAAFGGFVFVSSFVFTLYDMRGTQDDGYFYEPSSDKVLEVVGGTISNDTLAVFEVARDVYAGILHSYLVVPGSGEVTDRLAAAGSFSVRMGGKGVFSFSLLAGANLVDEYHSFRDGKVYLAAKAGFTTPLTSSN